MLGRHCCHAYLSWRCTVDHSVRFLADGQIIVSTFVWLLFLYASVLGGNEAISRPLGTRISKVSALFDVPAAALQIDSKHSVTENEGGQILVEASGDDYKEDIQPPSKSHLEVAHFSLSYWAAEADSSGENLIDTYTVVETAENAALYFTPSQLQSVPQLIQTTRREQLVEDEDRFRDYRFKSFTAGLRDFAQAKFRPFISRRAGMLHFKPPSRKDISNLAPQYKVPSDVQVDQGGHDLIIERLQLLEAVPGRFASKISVLVGGPKLQWNSSTDTPTCLGKKCASGVEEVWNPETPSALAHQVQRRVHDSHGLLQGFVSEVEGSVSDAELEGELRWELHIWNYLPSWRAVELAEKEHILIPRNLLRYERTTSFLDEANLVNQRQHTIVATRNRVEKSSKLDPVQAHVDGGSTGSTPNVDVEQEHSWSDRISGKVFNVFIYYPKGYRDTVRSSLIPSDQITETWYRTATTDFLLSISTQMILAVANLNSYGLVHTHIRPSSFVLDLDGVVLLSDLHRVVAIGKTMDCLSDRVRGINDLTASPEESACIYKYASNFEEHEDRKEFVVGPMQAEFPVDSWRLGVILYRLWCREPAHDRRSDHEFHIRHLRVRAAGRSVAVDAYLQENRLPMRYCRKDIPSSLQRLIRELLVAEPAFRRTAADAVKNSSLFHNLRHHRKQSVKHEKLCTAAIRRGTQQERIGMPETI